MIDSIRIEFKRLDSKTWSNSVYAVLVKLADYTEFDDSYQFGPDQMTHYKPLETSLKAIKSAKERIAKTEALLSFIETKQPERWQLKFYLDENAIRHSNSALNCIEIYF